LTGGQAGPTTPKGTKTITSSRGESYLPLRLGRILTTQAPYFYARTTVYHLNHFKTCIREALLWRGFSFVDIISDCIELNGRRLGFKTAYQMFKWFDQRFHIVEGERDHLQEDELGIAKAVLEQVPKPPEKIEAKPEIPIESLKPFTLQELQQFDGSGGKPIYIAYKGKYKEDC
jgi:pyruvate/2-oxoacid:ferredoxin oxidoreductase beta subunit